MPRSSALPALLAAALAPSSISAFQLTAKGLAGFAEGGGHHDARWGVPRCLWGPESTGRHSKRCQAVYNLALQESGLPAENVSSYGCNVPKVPYTWVEQIQAMDHTKKHTFNFVGGHQWSLDLQDGGLHWPQFDARNWVLDFAKANFSDDDYMKLTDIDAGYTPMAAWDHSSLDSFDSRLAHGTDGKEDEEYEQTFDRSYFEVMAASNFTLCPGGDMPWSMRFYEAIAAGSIPIIAKPMFDLSAPHLWALWDIPYKYYLLDSGDELVYRQDWVDYNYDLFVKYQTFHLGDLAPPDVQQ